VGGGNNVGHQALPSNAALQHEWGALIASTPRQVIYPIGAGCNSAMQSETTAMYRGALRSNLFLGLKDSHER
jgi:hypothetical protein